jgi:Alkaline phosphatase
MSRKIGTRIIALLMCVFILAGCAAQRQIAETSAQISPTPAAATAKPTISLKAGPTEAQDEAPKYIFLFIGDGMSYAQVQAAQIYKGSIAGRLEPEPLNFSQFPVVGTNTTYDTTSYIPDSAAAGTAIACGVKTETGTIGMEADGTAAQSIAELLKADGRKIGIVTSTSLNHATPAAFYAHADSRGDYYDIAVQMADSGFDYFGGGGIYQPTGSGKDRVNAYTLLEESGYAIADTKEEIEALGSASGKVYAVSPVLQGSEMLPFAIDAQEGDLTLADFVRKGIDVLEGEDGFFMMCEGGKIDPACHANDAAAAIAEVLDFEDAIQQAVNFMGEHPEETLIIITADHETGGMALGYTITEYDTRFEILQAQEASYLKFTAVIEKLKKDTPGLALKDALPVIKEYFGLIAPGAPGAGDPGNAAYVMTDEEYARLKAAFAEAMKPSAEREDSEEATLLYGGYNPLTVTLTHIMSGKAGIGWTTFYHTATLVPVYAAGEGAALFSGAYDDADIFHKLAAICGL